MAATTPYSGIDGACVFNSTTYNITSWTVNQTCEVKDSTDSGDVSNSVAWATNVSSGVKRWEATIEMLKNDGVVAVTIGTEATLTLSMDGSDSFSGTAISDSVGSVTTILEGDVTKETVHFVGDGELSETNS